MIRTISRRAVLGGAAALMLGAGAQAADPAECKEVHFSDVGWSCITATTAIASPRRLRNHFEISAIKGPKPAAVEMPIKTP